MNKFNTLWTSLNREVINHCSQAPTPEQQQLLRLLLRTRLQAGWQPDETDLRNMGLACIRIYPRR